MPIHHVSSYRLAIAAHWVHAGGVIAYPTEAVFGLGCNPLDESAVRRLLALKQRPEAKGLILLAADFRQLEPYVISLDNRRMTEIHAGWPGPHTWLLPARDWVPPWLCGIHDTIAVRVTAHTLAAALCRRTGMALVSTSANISHRPPARSPLQVRLQFGQRIDAILPGRLGELDKPTPIRDGRSGAHVRS